MLRMIRIAVLVVMFGVAVSLLIAIGRPETGPFEKAALAVALLVVLALARPVHRIGSA